MKIDWNNLVLSDLVQLKLIYEDLLQFLEGWQRRDAIRNLSLIDQLIEQRKDDEERD